MKTIKAVVLFATLGFASSYLPSANAFGFGCCGGGYRSCGTCVNTCYRPVCNTCYRGCGYRSCYRGCGGCGGGCGWGGGWW